MTKEPVQEEKQKDILGRALDFRKLKKENFVILFLVGILLLVIAWPAGGNKEETGTSKSGILDGDGSIMGLSGAGEEAERESAEGGTGLLAGDELQSYRISLERALEEILSCMEGAGEVRVMITLRSSGEAVVEKDFVSGQSSSSEADSEGGSRRSSQFDRSDETVYTSGSGGISVPYVKQVICPQIEGVIVCAGGGGSQSVNKNITEAIQALFGIEAHKIKVIKMSSK